MPNERVTENIVRDSLRSAVRGVKAHIAEQTPDNERVRKCLRHASKTGKGAGKPEFIVTFDEHQSFLIVVECKADIANHEGDDAATTAEGGARHYAKHLSRDYNVLAIAVSGTKKSTLRVSHFWHFKGDERPDPCLGKKLLSLEDYLAAYLTHHRVGGQTFGDMMLFAKDLNSRLHKLKVKTPHRSLLISAILMALQDPGFAGSYRSRRTPDLLMRDIRSTMLDQMRSAGLQEQTYAAVATSYGFMDAPGPLARGRTLADLAADIDESIHTAHKTHKYHDLLGRIYVEFLRYSNSDKGLGIVLTPPHITQLAADLAEVAPDDVLYDNCAGTGGFLIAGMKRMIGAACGDRGKIEKIKARGLVGVEFQDDITTLLSTNMFIHGDGRSNVFRGDCFDDEIQNRVRDNFQPTVGFLNPPFNSTSDELEFTLNNLETLKAGGKCVALLPMKCVLSDGKKRVALKQKLLENHTLEGVLSLPNELFHNSGVGVVTCLAVFSAHRPHPRDKETWLAFCKDDGFVVKKPLGRCDRFGEWERVRESWVRSYRNRERIPFFSVSRVLTAGDEWCAEGFIDVDYSPMAKIAIPAVLRDYVTFIAGREINRRLSAAGGGMTEFSLSSAPKNEGRVRLPDVSEWRDFLVSDLFRVTGTKTTPLEALEEIGDGDFPYVTTQTANNGVRGSFSVATEEGGVITVDSAVTGFASYQPYPFSASDHVEKLALQSRQLTAPLAMFLVAALNMNHCRYSYGRKASQARMRKMAIRLPALPDGKPDFALMERYALSLPFSSQL